MKQINIYHKFWIFFYKVSLNAEDEGKLCNPYPPEEALEYPGLNYTANLLAVDHL